MQAKHRTIDNIDYLARCVEAEAGNQDDTGKMLVIDVILNRLDSNDFPDTVWEVINQENQFKVVSNGYIWCVEPQDNIYNLINNELINRYNDEVLYFRTEYYHDYTIPLFRHQDHYFSK